MTDVTIPSLNVRRGHGVTIIDVPPDGVIHLADIAAVYDAIERVVHALPGPGACALLSFRDVKHVSSTFLGRLIALNKKMQARGGTLMLCEMDPAVREVFALAQLDRQLPVYRTVDEAISGRTTPWIVLLAILCVNAAFGINGLARVIQEGPIIQGSASQGIALACFIASIPLPIAVFMARMWYARLDRKFQWTLVGIFAFISVCALPAYLGMG
jgi:anti-anti-sigma factor